MSTLSKFTLQKLVKTHQKLNIQEAIGFRSVQPLQYHYQLSKLLAPILDDEYSDYENQKLVQLEGALIGIHPYQRWNERVGPITSFDELQFTIDTIVKVNPNRLYLINDEWALLDDDILFVYTIQDKILRIVSFYGRISCNPALNNIRKLKTFCFINGESINLSLTNAELKKQHMPIIPQEITKLSGRRTFYIVEKYYVQDTPQPYYVCYQLDKTTRNKSRFIINTAKPTQIGVCKSILQLLYIFGEYKFLSQYFLHFEPAKVAKFEQKSYISQWASYPHLIAK